jgi:hypothetical protein
MERRNERHPALANVRGMPIVIECHHGVFQVADSRAVDDPEL